MPLPKAKSPAAVEPQELPGQPGYGPGLRTEDGAGLANGEVPERGKGPQMDSDPRSRPGYNPFPSTNRQRESRREGKDSKGYVDPNVAHPLDHRLGAGYAWANMAGYKRLNSEWSSPEELAEVSGLLALAFALFQGVFSVASSSPKLSSQ